MQSVTWPLRDGSWTLLVMNPDGSRGVAADVAVGATLPAATWTAVALLVTGLVGLVVGIVVLLLAVRRRAR